MKTYILILITLFLTSCNLNRTYENREEDKKEAEKITQKFFSLVKENNKQEALKLFGKGFFKVSNKNELNQTIEWTKKEAGNISNYSLYEWETTVVTGTNPKANYLLVYNAQRDKINTEEIFSLEKENDSIKIIGYKVNLEVVTK